MLDYIYRYIYIALFVSLLELIVVAVLSGVVWIMFCT